ncbi:MAG: hypothetical protein FJX29_06620 [Alphaproteobacteria bacterium]|nr:hypothetical protein [Alphaproteobacteria bacterium]
MNRHILIAILAAGAVIFLMGAAVRTAPSRTRGERRLGWPLGMRIGVLLAIPFSFAIIWMAAQARPSQQMMAAIVSGCFLLGSLYLAYSVFLTRLWWTAQEISFWHSLGGVKTLRWEDIEDWRYLGWAQAFRISGQGKRLWYSPMQSGIVLLNKTIARKTNIPHLVPLDGDEIG